MDTVRMEAEYGTAFTVDGMLAARNKTRQAIRDIATHMQPGMIEEEAVTVAKQILIEGGMAPSSHPPRVRFGPNTLKGLRQPSATGMVLQENDIFFIAIASRYRAWEGNGGASFVVGHHPEYERCARDAELLFHALRGMWQRMGLTGQELYAYAVKEAQRMGWDLNPDLPGHRVADFPHAALHTGSLADYPNAPSEMRWILEIHLLDPQRRFGAFFEDMLLDDSHYR